MNYRYTQVAMHPLYGFCHYLVGVVYDQLFRGEVAGVENLPKSGGFLIAANHASHLDPPLVGAQVPYQMSFFARKTLWKPGFVSWWMDSVGCIPVDRDGGSDIQALKRVLKVLAEGKILILFPEGTRSPDGKLHEPKAGVGFMACKAGVPVVPARVFGSFKAFGRSGKLRLGTPVSVVFDKPVQPEAFAAMTGKERYQKASELIMQRIAALEEPHYPVI
jgi:1-acyl-sn-glycerol-3-phosphate acyltransferase